MNTEVRLIIEGVMATDAALGTRQPGRTLCALSLCILNSVVCLLANAQPFAVDWHSIDGGGGASTGGVFSVSGTIGQPDAGAQLTGGPYTLRGGFWSVVAIQTPGAPVLSIAPIAPGQARISWTPSAPGWVLQETASLSLTNWINSASGSTNPVVVTMSGNLKLYRLFQP